ncbi:MAG: CvpA family protein [Candidatus Omnitrophota bacterium]|nr:CvpA family protein [Candidatus Omnitrophota bacterium]
MLDNILKYINWVDILIIIWLFRSAYVGLETGMWHQLLGLIGVVAAIFIPFRSYAKLSGYLSGNFSFSASLANIVSFISLLIAVIIVIGLIRKISKKLVKVEFISVLESIGGSIIGLVQASLMSGLILLVFTWLSITLRGAIVDRSYLGSRLINAPVLIYDGLVKLYPMEEKDETKNALTGKEISNNLDIRQ